MLQETLSRRRFVCDLAGERTWLFAAGGTIDAWFRSNVLVEVSCSALDTFNDGEELGADADLIKDCEPVKEVELRLGILMLELLPWENSPLDLDVDGDLEGVTKLCEPNKEEEIDRVAEKVPGVTSLDTTGDLEMERVVVLVAVTTDSVRTAECVEEIVLERVVVAEEEGWPDRETDTL